MQTALNRFIEMLKWPAALFMLVTLPALFQSLSWFKFGQPKYLVMFAGIDHDYPAVGYVGIHVHADFFGTAQCDKIKTFLS